MVPVEMADKHMGRFGRILFFNKGISKGDQTGAHIENNKIIIGGTYLHAGRMSAYFNFIPVGGRERSSYTPEFYTMRVHDKSKCSE